MQSNVTERRGSHRRRHVSQVKQLLEAADKDCQHTAEDGDDRMKVAQLLGE